MAEYAHVYNTDEKTVPANTDIAFTNNGVISGNITHVPGTAAIKLGNAGDYEITVYFTGNTANQLTVAKNGAPIPGGIFGTSSAADIAAGSVIVTADAGDIITVRNFDASRPIYLTVGSGIGSTNASVIVRRYK